MTVDTSDVNVLVRHRLALGVEPIDAISGFPVGQRVQVGREATAVARRPRTRGALDPVARRQDLPLETYGTGKFKLRHGPGVSAVVTVRVADPTRAFVPRRFEVPLWTLAEVDSPSGPNVPARSRLLRPWLLPGAAYPVQRGATGLRGRIARDGQPVPWPRVAAVGRGGQVLGRAHGDERGEFLLLLTTSDTVGTPPAVFDVQLVLHGPPAGAVQPDPVAEPVIRSSAPPLPSDLNNPLLRGETVPASYVQSITSPTATIPIGEIRSVPTPFTFWP